MLQYHCSHCFRSARTCVCVAVSRSTVCKSIKLVQETIVRKMDIPAFPLDDAEKLAKLAAGFKKKSCGNLFQNVVGAFDGYLLQVTLKCLSQEPNAHKYFCRCVEHFFAW